MNSWSPWPKLDRALAVQQFTGFQLPGLSSQDLAGLETAVASAQYQFVNVVENREWQHISRQLARLQYRAQYIALRPHYNNLDIVVGKQPSRDMRPGERYVDAEKSYVEFVQNLLAALYPAAQTFTLSAQARNSANQIFDTAGSIVGSNPGAAAAVAAAKLVVPFLRFRGIFRCVVVVSAGGVNQDLANEWWQKRLFVFPYWPPHASAQGWIWDTITDKVYDTNTGFYPAMEIPGLRSANQLAEYFRHTG